MVEFSTGGGRALKINLIVATQIQKKMISALFQILDYPRLFRTILLKQSFEVRWVLFSPEYMYRIGRAGWLIRPIKIYDRQESRCTRRRRFDLQATS
jgi:hypothetical protein